MFAPTVGTIITGNPAATRQLRREFDAARKAEGLLVWDSPDILPCEAWLRRSWAECAWHEPATTPVLLTRSQELTLWESAIAASTRDVLLNAGATAIAASQAWGLLHAWPEAAPQGSFAFEEARFDVCEDTRAFFGWMQKIRKRLQERGWITLAEIPGALLSRSGAGPFAGPIALHGFDEISTADCRLFDALGAVHRDPPPSGGSAAQASRVVCHDAADELTQAAVWARRKLEARERGGALNLGILIPDVAAQAALAARIFDDVLHPSYGFARNPPYGFAGSAPAFTISAGESWADHEMIAAALRALRLLDEVPREEAAVIWRSPYLGMEPGEAARLDVELRRRNVEFAGVRVESVKRRFPGVAAVAATLPARMRPSEWSAAFSRLLRVAGWPGTRTLTPAENRALEAWKDLLSELARLDVVLDSISSGNAISRLESIAKATGMALDEENAPVRILNMADAAGSRFDALWIAGLHAGAWPPRARPNPFLPVALQRAAGMPRCSAEREIGYARRVMERRFASANEIACSFPAHAADEEQRPSPWLAALPLLPALPSQDTAIRRGFLQAAALECRPAEEPVPVPPGTVQRGGTSVLADQSACAFRAFAIHRLRAREMDQADVGLSAMERGSAVHKALELLWEELRSQARLQKLEPDALESLIRSCAEAALEHFVSRREDSRALEQFRKLEQPRLEHLLRQWLAVESARPNFEVIRNEDEQVVEVAGLTVKIRADRIDRYDDGTHAIIDYKTSKKISTDMWRGERPEAPQLPLYATTSVLPISEVGFAQLTTEAVEWKGVRGRDLEEQMASWRGVVRRLAEDFLSGRADVDPREKPNPCELCKLSALCRLTENGKTLVEADDE